MPGIAEDQLEYKIDLRLHQGQVGIQVAKVGAWHFIVFGIHASSLLIQFRPRGVFAAYLDRVPVLKSFQRTADTRPFTRLFDKATAKKSED
ncbi:hypothetical protein JCM31598_17110 [Desulfonatronum parangueonense]